MTNNGENMRSPLPPYGYQNMLFQVGCNNSANSLLHMLVEKAQTSLHMHEVWQETSLLVNKKEL